MLLGQGHGQHRAGIAFKKSAAVLRRTGIVRLLCRRDFFRCGRCAVAAGSPSAFPSILSEFVPVENGRDLLQQKVIHYLGGRHGSHRAAGHPAQQLQGLGSLGGDVADCLFPAGAVSDGDAVALSPAGLVGEQPVVQPQSLPVFQFNRLFLFPFAFQRFYPPGSVLSHLTIIAALLPHSRKKYRRLRQFLAKSPAFSSVTPLFQRRFVRFCRRNFQILRILDGARSGRSGVPLC